MDAARVAAEGPPQESTQNTESARFRVTSEVLDASRIAALVASDASGAVATFVGLVRDHNAGRRVRWIDYEAHGPLAENVFRRIAGETSERWPAAVLAIHHREGRVEIGEASVVIAAASAHRADAFAACRFAIERVKQIAPVWKHEHFEGGEVWIEGAVADPDDRTALEAAARTACA